MQKIYRCYAEKRPGFDVAAKAIQSELIEVLGLGGTAVRILNRYDLQGIAHDKWHEVISTVLSEPQSDVCFDEHLPEMHNGVRLLCVEPLPGQFDVRADSCEQCVQMLLGGLRPIVKTAKTYVISGVCDADFERVKKYLINPLESREASGEKPIALTQSKSRPPDDISEVHGFIGMDTASLEKLRLRRGLAMSLADLSLTQGYFKAEHRDPTITELRVIDTYWSDHCRHTTFNTIIESADIHDERVKKAYELFVLVNDEKPVTLMNMATAAMRCLRKQGKLPMLDESEENNACTIRIKADSPHGQEAWLLFFKNETHNHPSEIEPYGGASTCIGGAIRDPLSGRAYVYQSMRISGAGDPRTPFGDTLPGKLHQRKLTVTAAEGFSSYGNQIGLATGFVREIYHEGYVAKRLECGTVIGAAPLTHVHREKLSPGDVIILLGGRTGRDGIGGATGSSKMHSTETVSACAAEVQKGNAPEERKLQRLFRNPDVTKLIKKCNDFGAGGASVAIGELADGVEINLDAFPVKYEGLDGTELAVSESQERMAAVVAESDVVKLLQYAEEENIEATAVARVTERKRLIMMWRGRKIVDIDRAFLDTNGAERFADVYVPCAEKTGVNWTDLTRLCADLNFCSQKGLVERFDNTIGASSVLMPFGGKYALSETQVMAALLPAKGTKTASVMAYGFDPYFTETDPFGGSAYAVVMSVAKLISSGVELDTIHLSLQEYFPRVNDDPARWGLPFTAMLGAFSAQLGLGIAAIGGKDSMSGSFEELDVPPTLISFAAGISDAARLISSEFKKADSFVYLLKTPMNQDGLPDYEALRELWSQYTALLESGKVLSAWVCEHGGVYGGIVKMSLGNMIGFSDGAKDNYFERQWGSIIFEATEKLDGYTLLGYTQSEPVISFGGIKMPLTHLHKAWEAPLESVFPVKTEQSVSTPTISDSRRHTLYRGEKFLKPKAVIPVFPGTNCEYDTAAAVERVGGVCEIILVRNLTPELLQLSIMTLEKALSSAQMLIIPGGFSGGDEPDGSGKFIVSLLRNPRLTNAVHDLLQHRDGLVLGICNGFQALIKLGLLPYGKITATTPECPTLAHNTIGRHQSRYVSTRVASVISPWLSKCSVGEVYTQPVSHGEGRFAASVEVLETLKSNGQIVFQYLENPNGSDWNIEGICSPDGRILGKMAHTERYGEYVAKNIPGNKFMPLFESGVDYFR